MAAKSRKIKGISHKQLKHYVEMRHKLDKEANAIYCITSLLAQLESCSDDKLEIDAVALGKINQMLNTNILNIWEILDDFISVVEAKLNLK